MDEIVDLYELTGSYLSVSLHHIGQRIVRHVFHQRSFFWLETVLFHEATICVTQCTSFVVLQVFFYIDAAVYPWLLFEDPPSCGMISIVMKDNSIFSCALQRA